MSARNEDLFHIGIVVKDFEATCAQLGRTSGVEWSPTISTEVPIWTPDAGIRALQFRAAYSIAAPHLEIVQSIGGTIMAETPGRPLHHLGYWSDDLAADSERLERQGLPRVMCAVADGKMFGFAYHVTPDGLYQELVDRRAFPDWQGFLTGKFKFESKVL